MTACRMGGVWASHWKKTDIRIFSLLPDICDKKNVGFFCHTSGTALSLSAEVVGNWTCRSSLKIFRLSSSPLPQVQPLTTSALRDWHDLDHWEPSQEWAILELACHVFMMNNLSKTNKTHTMLRNRSNLSHNRLIKQSKHHQFSI